MESYKIILLAISFGFASVLYASEGSSSSVPTRPGRVISGLYHTGHARDRMAERQVSKDDIKWVIGHGNRYNAFDRSKPLDCSRQLCVDTNKKLGIIIDRNTNNVITVLRGMSKQRLEAWIAQYTPTKEERIALAKQHAADIYAAKK